MLKWNNIKPDVYESEYNRFTIYKTENEKWILKDNTELFIKKDYIKNTLQECQEEAESILKDNMILSNIIVENRKNFFDVTDKDVEDILKDCKIKGINITEEELRNMPLLHV